MPVGKKVIVKIPPEYAYGAKGTPGGPIPPDAPLLSMAKKLGSQPARQPHRSASLARRP
jgi:hypothetical protein